MKRFNTAVHVITLFAVLYGMAWLSTSTFTYFSNDNGLRFLQIRELIQNNFSSLAINYPARLLDPNLQYTPYYYAYSVINGEIFLQISTFLPLITAWLYRSIGTFALPLLPVLGGILTATAVFQLGKLAKVKYPYLLLWTTIFATPLLFYSLELWDHSLATAATSWAIVGIAYSLQTKSWIPALGGGIALGLGFGQRPETYVFAIALGLTWLLLNWREWPNFLVFVLGASATTIPTWLFNWRWTGHPLGMSVAPHLFHYGVPVNEFWDGPGRPRIVTLTRFILYVQGKDILIFAAAILIILGIFLLIYALRIPRLQKKWLLWLAFSSLIIGNMIMVGQTFGQPIPGILSTFPLVALSFVYIGKEQDRTAERKVYLLVLLTAVLFLVLMLAFWPSSGGIQWGARYLLPIYPLLIFLAFYVFSIQIRLLSASLLPAFQKISVGLLITSIILQVVSINLMYQSHYEQIWIREAINNLPANVIMTNNPFLPSSMAAITNKQFMYINGIEDLEVIVPRLAQNGILRFALVTTESMPIAVPSTIGNIFIRQSSPLIYDLASTQNTNQGDEP